MNIQAATKLAMENGKTIYRLSNFDRNRGSGENLEIIPTNVYGYIVIKPKNLALYKSWIPNAEDILADDWEVKGLNRTSLDQI